MTNRITLSEHSQQLLVDIILLQYRDWGYNDETYCIFGAWRFFDHDLRKVRNWRNGFGLISEDDSDSSSEDLNDSKDQGHALVLIQWNDSRRRGTKRLMLMAIKWIAIIMRSEEGLLRTIGDNLMLTRLNNYRES
jgi:hypothetical protein